MEGFIPLTECLKTCNIHTLKAKNNLLGDESMKYFSSAILVNNTTSKLDNFDFSSCKIYDQGLIYMFNQMMTNEKIKKIKLKDNYFSHEVDFVLIEYLEKNTNLVHLDVSRCRLSFQCMQRVQQIIERNVKYQNDKKPNELLTKLYNLKYENIKLNEMKDILKDVEGVSYLFKIIRLLHILTYNIYSNYILTYNMLHKLISTIIRM